MKIGFVGCQCSGKTTALWYVGSYLKNRGVTDFTLVQENARKCPYPINQKGTFHTANWILLNQILAEAEALRKWKHVITDRTVIDPYLYLFQAMKGRYSSLVKCSQVDYVRDLCKSWKLLSPYDAIFFFRPLPLIADADRSVDKTFQLRMDALFVDYFIVNQIDVIEVDSPKRGTRCELVARKIYEELLR